MRFNTLAEEQEHRKQSAEYKRHDSLEDEATDCECWACGETVPVCNSTFWQFSWNIKQRWHCNQCFKEQVGE